MNELTQRGWFRRRFGQVGIEVRHKAHGSATGYRSGVGVHPAPDGSIVTGPWGRIVMPPWSRTEPIILHEVAHVLTPNEFASHGPEFAGVYFELVRFMLGAEAAKSQRGAFREARVKMNRKALPPR